MEIKEEVKIIRWIEYDGIKFYPDQRGYWIGNVKDPATGRVRPKRLHIYVWEKYNGPVQKGFHVHHKDHNSNNNNLENLELISKFDHLSMHGQINSHKAQQSIIRYAMPAAKEWHKSKEGRKWHALHYQQTLEQTRKTCVKKRCIMCGKEFETDILMQQKAKFCSNACKSQHRRQTGVDNVTRICVICGNTFTTNKYSKAQTCGPVCRANLRHRRMQTL